MLILPRVGISADGFVAIPDRMSALAAMPSFQPGGSRGTQNLDAVVMGRNTFLPALGAPRWPWPGLQIYVLTSRPLPPADTRRWRNLTRRASGPLPEATHPRVRPGCSPGRRAAHDPRIP